MIGSEEYRRTRLETEQQIQFYNRQKQFFPYARHEVQFRIDELKDYLELLALEYRRQWQRKGSDFL
jgi:hypothetical protein